MILVPYWMIIAGLALRLVISLLRLALRVAFDAAMVVVWATAMACGLLARASAGLVRGRARVA